MQTARLEVLTRQLAASCHLEQSQLVREETSSEERPLPGGGRGTLSVVDNRTGKKYTVCTEKDIVSPQSNISSYDV